MRCALIWYETIQFDGSNNLGIIENLRGQYGGAIGAHTRALAAFQTANNGRGLVLIHHNRANYRPRKPTPIRFVVP